MNWLKKNFAFISFIVMSGMFGMQQDLPTDQQLVNNTMLKNLFYNKIVANCDRSNIKYDLDAAKLAFVWNLLKAPIDQLSIEKLNQASSLITTLAFKAQNLWVKYYAIYLYTTIDLPILIQSRKFKNYFGNPNIALKIQEMLQPVLEQNINIRAKANAALFLGGMRLGFTRNKDYSLIKKYYSIAANQDCDQQVKDAAERGLESIDVFEHPENHPQHFVIRGDEDMTKRAGEFKEEFTVTHKKRPTMDTDMDTDFE